MSDITQQLQEQIATAIAEKKPLDIIGGNSKAFYGRPSKNDPLHLRPHTGIVNYEPTELVMTARAGTSLEEIEAELSKSNQMLPFEPPHYGPNATIGGTIACNLSGPRRAYAGAARDYVLGTKVINGKAEVLHFGGEVMKNVAGYDVSRLMVGAMGTLGALLEVSFKVLPRFSSEITLVQDINASDAITKMSEWAGKPNPLSATAHIDGKLYVRLSGADSALQAARQRIGGELLPEAETFWLKLREHQLPTFNNTQTVWRISVPQTIEPLKLDGEQIIEWGGGLRWLIGDENANQIRESAIEVGGHATLFKGGDQNKDQDIFQPLEQGLEKLHRNLKHAFDPHSIFNPDRMFKNL